MAPNGKPSSYVMQQQQAALLQPVMNTKDPNIQVKKECILFSQSVMNGWTPNSGNGNAQMSQANSDGPEPRILSKKRRDLINAEIRELQNLLPLKKSSRERLSYLGILALTNTFIRKATFFKKECIGSGNSASSGLVSDFANSLSGFLLVFNRDGKILFSSDNILDYLGHTVVELASQGDSIYDIIDKEDHEMIKTQLELQPQTESGEARDLSFFCRMSTSRYMKTQMRSWKNKIVHVVGKYHKPEMSNDWSDTAFFAVCEPIESKPVTDVRHHPSPRPTEFKAVHSPDMKFLEVPSNVSTLLGYEPEELTNTSWYQWIFPDDLNQARQQHMKFVKEDGSTFACVIRMIHKNGSLVWVDITAEKSQETISNTFVCNYITIEEDEVPYYRLHHNLLPFPDHYTEVKKHYLAAKSSLLASALNNDAALASPGGMTSPSGRHPQSPQGMSHMIMTSGGFLPDNMDTKTILRRQLKRKLGVSMDSALAPGVLSAGSYAAGMEIFNLPPPNKMMIRRHTASELLYPSGAPGMYHAGIHPSAYHDMATQHAMYMSPPPLLNDSVLMHPQYRSDYLSQRSVDLPIHDPYSPSSPRTLDSPMLRQSNQNNNVRAQEMYNPNMVEFKRSPPPAMTNGYNSPVHSSPSRSPAYTVNEPPKLNHVHSPPLPTAVDSPMGSPQHNDVINQSPDNFYCDVNGMVDCAGSQMTACSMNSGSSMSAASPVSVSGNYSPAHSGYGSPAECVTSQMNGPIDAELRNLISSYENQFQEEKPMLSQQYTSCAVGSPLSNSGQYSPQTYSSMTSSPRPTNAYQPCSPPQQSPPYESPTRYAHISSPSQAEYRPINANCSMEAKPYQLQTMNQRAAFARTQRRCGLGERSSDWLKRYSHMSAMEMLLSDSESNSAYCG